MLHDRLTLRANTRNIQIEGRPDIIIDLSQPGQLDTLKDKPFNIKEGTTFRMSVRFRVQHQILSGMKYLQVVKRMGISSKTQEMIVRRLCWPNGRGANVDTRGRIAQTPRTSRPTKRRVSAFYRRGMEADEDSGSGYGSDRHDCARPL